MSNLKYEDVRYLLNALREIEARIEESKKLYAKRDELTLELVAKGFTTMAHEGVTYELSDNFAHANVAYRAAFVRRYEIKIKTEKA
jgi:hypothetical protein